MSVLPAGQSLLRYIPDLDDLLHDPASYLSAGPLVFGPRQMYRLAGLFLLAGAIFVGSVFYTGTGSESTGERLALGIGLMLGGSLWLGWSLMLRGHRLSLHKDGVEVKYLDTTVWCPWSLFNADGEARVPLGDSPLVGLMLPVNPEAMPYIELRRHDAPIAQGAQVKARQLVFTSPGEVVLPGRYEVRADELGFLILQLGRRLGRQLPAGTPPPEARRLDDLEMEAPSLGAGGWVSAPVSRLRFPPLCCRCGQAADDTMPFVVEGRLDWLLGLFAHRVRPLAVEVPVCPFCQQVIEAWRTRGGALGMLLGAAAAATAAVLLGMRLPDADLGFLVVLGLGAAALGGLLGFAIGNALCNPAPVRLRRFSPERGTVSVWFRDHDYAEKVLDVMRAQDRAERTARKL
jgi:hypothetical protein